MFRYVMLAFVLACMCLVPGCSSEGFRADSPGAEQLGAGGSSVQTDIMTADDVQAYFAEVCTEDAVQAEYAKCLEENAALKSDPGFGETVFARTRFGLDFDVPGLVGAPRGEMLRVWGLPDVSLDECPSDAETAPHDEWPLGHLGMDTGAYCQTWTAMDVEYDGGFVTSASIHVEFYLD